MATKKSKDLSPRKNRKGGKLAGNVMRRSLWVGVIAVCLSGLGAGRVEAGVILFNDLALWEAGITGIQTETFDGFTTDVSFIGNFVALNGMRLTGTAGFNGPQFTQKIDASPFEFFGGQYSVNGTTFLMGETWGSVAGGLIHVEFDQPTTAFGLDARGIGEDGNTVINVYDASNNVLFSTFISSGVGDLDMHFIGYQLTLGDAASYFEILSGFVDPFGIDNIRFAQPDTTAVPEPATLLLLGTGAAGLLAKARRRKQHPRSPF
jgi:PEP-CTERM motif